MGKTKVLPYYPKDKTLGGDVLKPEYAATAQKRRAADGDALLDIGWKPAINSLDKKTKEQLDQKRRAQTARKSSPPSYYSADAAALVSVRGETEEALLAISSENKRKAIDYLKLFTNAGGSVSGNDYNDLLVEYSNQLVNNSTLAQIDITSVTTNFDNFRKNMFSTVDPLTRESVVEGITPLMSAMAKGIGRLGVLKERIEFRSVIDGVSSNLFTNAVSDELKKELRSWIRVIASYA